MPYTFNENIFNDFIYNEQIEFTCKDIYNTIIKCYNVNTNEKIDMQEFIFQMCKDSLQFKNEKNSFIADFIDITIFLLYIKQNKKLKKDYETNDETNNINDLIDKFK